MPEQQTSKEEPAPPSFSQIVAKAGRAGIAGGVAMAIQVTSLMWMRTTMNYQFRNGGSFIPTLKTLYAQGGIARFYRGIVPALVLGPNSRFGDTAANMFATTIFSSNPNLKQLPLFIQTGLGSFMAGCYRIFTLPLDAWKTSKQVNGPDGLKMLVLKFNKHGISAFYQGGLASALGTMAGHYPWFVTNNYLEHYLPKVSFKQEFGKAIIRSAGIGFCCTLVSDTVSNSIRVVKTFKQTATQRMTYKQVVTQIVAKDGITGLLFRGLPTKLMTNALQGMVFSVAWKYLQHKMESKKQ